MQVRQADVNDVNDLARLRAVWREQPPSDEFIATFRDWFLREHANRWWWMAIDDDEPVGMVNLKIFDRMPSPDQPASRWGYLANLFVAPGRRGAGAGTSLVAAAVDRARAERLVRVVLSVRIFNSPLRATRLPAR